MIQNHNEKLTEINLELSNLKHVNEELKTGSEKLKSDKESLVQKLAEMDNLRASSIANETILNSRIEESNEKLLSAEMEVEAFKTNIIQMQNEISTLKDEMSNKDDREHSLQNELVVLRQNITQLETDYSAELSLKTQQIQINEEKHNTTLKNMNVEFSNLKNSYEIRLSELQSEKDKINSEFSDIQRQLCAAINEKANVNQELCQESFEQAYLDEIKQISQTLNESTYTNVSEIFFLTTDTTINDQTSLFCPPENIDELQHTVNNLMAKCGILEISTTVSDVEITNLRDDMSILKEKMVNARFETDKLFNEINEFITNELDWINTPNAFQKEIFLEDFQDFQSLKEERSTLENQIIDEYCELEPNYIIAHQATCLTNQMEQENKKKETEIENLVNDYEQKLISLFNEKEQLGDEITELQSRRQLALIEKESVLNELHEYLAEIQDLRSKLAKMENDNKQLSLDYEQKFENNLNIMKQIHEKQIAQNIQANHQELENVTQSYQLKLESLTSDYEAKLLELIQKKDQVCSEILSIQCQLTAALGEKEILLAEIDSLKIEIASLKSQMLVEKENYSNLEKSSRQLAEENFLNVQRLGTELQETKSINEGLKTENDVLNKKLVDTDEMHQLKMENLLHDFGTCKSDLKSQIEEANEKLSNTYTSLKSMEDNITEMQTEILSLRDKLKQNEKERENEQKIQKEISDIKERAIEIENKYNDLITKNTKMVDEYEIKLCSVLNEKEQITNQIEELNFKMRTTEQERDDFHNKIELLNTESEAERLNYLKEIDSLKQAYEQKLNDNDFTLQAKSNELKAQYYALESTYESATNEINELKIVELKLKEELTNSLNSLEKVNQECSEFKSKKS